MTSIEVLQGWSPSLSALLWIRILPHPPRQFLSKFMAALCFSDLPHDILYTIIDHTAASSLDSALALTLVSSWTRHIALPYIYGTIVFPRYSERFQIFFQTISTASTDVDLSGNVLKHMHLGDCVNNIWLGRQKRNMEPVLKLLPRVQNLAVSGCHLGTFLSCGNQFPHCRKLTITRGAVPYFTVQSWQAPPDISPFTSITHLQFSNPFRFLLLVPWLPSLTHLAIPFSPRFGGDFVPYLPGNVDDVLRCWPDLVMLVIMIDPWYESYGSSMYLKWEADGRGDDPRVYMVAVRDDAVERDAWEEAARGGEDIWARAIRLGVDGRRNEGTKSLVDMD